jgi:CRP/FNR family transcriptional regulator, cyclic AMP receptor protein
MLRSKIELFQGLPIFSGLSEKQLGLIVNAAVKVFFEAGENLILKDERGDTALLIMTGAARCLQFPGAPAASENIEPGSLVGELAMLVDTVHPFTVQARDRVRALALKRGALKRVMEREPAIAQKISNNLVLRLRNFARDLRRLDNYLAEIEASPSQAENAYRLRESANPALSRLPLLPGQGLRKSG